VTIGRLRCDVPRLRRSDPTASIAEPMFFLRRLKTPAVDLFHLEGVHIDAVHASDIDSRQFCAGLRVRDDALGNPSNSG
jgi:hypothetical protein